jgi:hypothetical protein
VKKKCLLAHRVRVRAVVSRLHVLHSSRGWQAMPQTMFVSSHPLLLLVPFPSIWRDHEV